MLHFLNTSKTGWGCSQIRQTVGLVPVSWGNPDTSGWVLRAEYPLWSRTRKALLPSNLLFQHNQEYKEAEGETRGRAVEIKSSVTLKQKPHVFFIFPGSSPWPPLGIPCDTSNTWLKCSLSRLIHQMLFNGVQISHEELTESFRLQ